MITHQLAVNLILERIAMAKKPTPHKKLKGTRLGDGFGAETEKSGRTVIKPKASRKTSVSQKIARRKSKKVTVRRRTV